MPRKLITKIHFVTELATNCLTHEKVEFFKLSVSNCSISDQYRGKKRNIYQNRSLTSKLVTNLLMYDCLRIQQSQLLYWSLILTLATSLVTASCCKESTLYQVNRSLFQN